jgi:hypothetical protein
VTFVTLGQAKFRHGVSLEAMHIEPLAPEEFCPNWIRERLPESRPVLKGRLSSPALSLSETAEASDARGH